MQAPKIPDNIFCKQKKKKRSPEYLPEFCPNFAPTPLRLVRIMLQLIE